MNTQTLKHKPVNNKKPDFDKKSDVLRMVSKALNYASLDSDIPEFIVMEAKKNGLIIVFAHDSYVVKVLGDHDKMTTYQNTGEIWLRHNEFFIEPECVEHERCKYFEERKGLARRISFDLKERRGWFCKTDIAGVFFNLLGENGDVSRGIVFHKDELTPRFTDKELLDGLEKIRTEHAKGRWTPNQLILHVTHINIREALTSFLVKNETHYCYSGLTRNPGLVKAEQ